ncbi:MAG TPA: hypothetical protein VNU72_05785 [Puia sp.]|jgi:hypothetical protein|nr:hypothetical protein [Puia sp.]
MSFTFDVIVNPIILLAGVIVGAIIGFVVGKAKLAKAKSRISKLETELLNSHTETLEAQQAYVALERHQDQSIPVISMKINGNGKETAKEKLSK